MAFEPTNKPWPPPPDVESIQELVAVADIEDFISEGAPADEYETEAELLFNAVENFPTADLTAAKLMPIIADIWHKGFNLDAGQLSAREAKFAELAAQIERFFGPEAQPQVRGN